MTYHVIHADGQKYGPATIEDLRLWLREGRIGPDSPLEDENGQRSFLKDLPDFETIAAPPVAPQPMTPVHPAEGASRKSGTAWVVPVVVGCLVVAVLGMCLLAAVLFPVFSQARIAAQRTVARQHGMELGQAVLQFVANHGDHFPSNMTSARAARAELEPYVRNGRAFRTPNPNGGEFLGNGKLSGAKLSDVVDPAGTPMFYESMEWTGGHRVVVYVDGHVVIERHWDPAAHLSSP